MSQQLNLSLTELTTAKNEFSAKYTSLTDPVSDFARDIHVNWNDFKNAIETNISWSPDQTLLRFFHRYDESGWFLTMECCHVTEDGVIDIYGTRFIIKNDIFQVTTDFTADYDLNYFENVGYESLPLVNGVHVRSMIFPWSQEFKAAAAVNNVLDAKNINLVFSSISFDFGNDRSVVNVQWPHTIAFYFSKDGVAMLDNVVHEGGGVLIAAKAYDYADACPSNCDTIYQWPPFFETV